MVHPLLKGSWSNLRKACGSSKRVVAKASALVGATDTTGDVYVGIEGVVATAFAFWWIGARQNLGNLSTTVNLVKRAWPYTTDFKRLNLVGRGEGEA